MYLAAREGDTEEVVRLLWEGANPNWQNEFGRTAMHWACLRNHHHMLTVLINGNNANINIKDGYNDTPLHIACMHGSFECVSLLADAGCDSG